MQSAFDPTTPSAAPGPSHPELTTNVDWSTIPSFYPRKITRFRHQLDREPLLQMDSLRALAKRLEPRGQVKFKPAVQTAVHDAFITQDADSRGRSIDQVFDHISDPASWLAIYQMNEDPQYAAFCHKLLAEVNDHVGINDPGMYGPDLAVFLSSPPAFTPYHIDQHPVFFFQVRGKKRLNLWDSFDPEVLDPALVEEFLCSKVEGKIKFREALKAKVVEIELGPGDGVYWPATTPHLTHTEGHWVTRDNGFSLSFNISYYTNETRRRLCISALNQLLRNHSPIRPSPYGQSDLRDRIKHPFGRAFLEMRRLVKRQYMRPEQGL